MLKLFNRLIRNKLLFSLIILLMLTFFIDFIIVIFDVVQLIIVSKNATRLSSAFFGFNIFGLILNIMVASLGIGYYFLKRRNVKSKN